MQEIQTDIVIVGSGAGGSTVAKELAGRGQRVLVLEKGSEADPPNMNLIKRISSKYHEGLLLHSISRRLQKVTGIDTTIPIHYRTGIGGTTTLTSANAVRSLEKELSAFGVNISEELREIEQELNVTPFPQNLMGQGAKKLCEAASLLGITMEPMTKCMDFRKCAYCKKCSGECPKDVKWTATSFIRKAHENGVSIMKNITVNEVFTANGTAAGVKARSTAGEMSIRAHTVILSAGAIGTAVILQKSGIRNAGKRLFCDPYYFVFGPDRNNFYTKEPRAIINAEFVQKDSFMLTNCIVPNSSGIAGYLPESLKPKVKDLSLGILIKIRDESVGSVSMHGQIVKTMTHGDLEKLNKGLPMAIDILAKAGLDHRHIKIRGPGGAHPGGTAAIGEVVDHNLETEIKNLFLADASVLPEAPGLPPMLTILALSKRLGKKLAGLL